VATVSKVMNARYGVSVATARRVQETIDELGYETSLVARSLRSHRTMVIGILVGEFESFGTEILKGASAAIAGTGYELLAYSAGDAATRPAWERRHLSRLAGTLVDGAVLVAPTVAGISSSVPVVCIDPHTGPDALPSVASDNHAGAVAATDHLLGLGHRRIAFVGGRPELESARQRDRGFRDAMQAAGVEVDESLVVVGGYRRDVALEPARRLLAAPEPPTAVLAANDYSAFAVLDAAASLGLRVPDDLSVVGFDNIPESALTEPPLTTVSQPVQELGVVAVQLLLGMLADTAAAAGTAGTAGVEDPDGATEPLVPHVQLPTKLVERRTTARVR
jgi:LacI family transcriptional regulator